MLSPKKIKGPHICCPFDIGADKKKLFSHLDLISRA